MKSVLIGVALVAAAAATPDAWRVGQGDVRVVCPMTIGGSFDAKTTALSGSIAVSAKGVSAFDGSLAVDLRTLDTGIELRNEHLRDNYLEVAKQPGYDTATLSQIDLKGLKPDAPEGKGSFTGSLALHGVSKTVAGTVDVRRMGDALRVKASFPVNLLDYSIRRPRYLGIGVKDIVQVDVTFSVTQ